MTISFGILLGIILNIFLSSFKGGAVNLFVLVYSSSVLPGMVPWFVILLSELRFRRANPEIIQNHPFVMPLYPMSNYLAIFSLFLIVVFMFINPDTRASVTVGFVFLMVLTINFIIKFRRKRG